jgi:hypothetical protein
MADFSGTTSVSTAPDVLFDYLSDVGHLPDYFARMTSAAPGEGEEVRTTARMPDGQEVQGDAWFRVDATARTLEWGSEGPSAYAGRLEVRPAGDGSEVEVHLRTTRVEEGDVEVQDGISETLQRIKDRAESLP